MKLIFNQPHLSIRTFEPVELSSFAVVTGVNGSGKTHLLQAIEQGSIAVEGVHIGRIAHFNQANFQLSNEARFTAPQLQEARQQAWRLFEKYVSRQAANLSAPLRGRQEELRDACQRKGCSIWALDDPTVQQYRKGIEQFMGNKDLKNNREAQAVFALIKRIEYGVDELSKDEFMRRLQPYELAQDFLPIQLGRVIWDYYCRFAQNATWDFRNHNYGEQHQALTNQDFERLYGRKPWDVVNEILSNFTNLPYRVNSPEGLDIFGSYQLKLVHTEQLGLEIDFGNLSSGERVLMALVASTYKAASDGLFPDLILLDEVDASLHPSMIKTMFKVIQSVFLERGVKVVMVTHSPTTIALAPEDAVYVMNRVGNNRLTKASKTKALAILTEGFATLEQGLSLFDQAAKSKLTLISEGHNALILKKALEVFEIAGVEVMEGVEGVSGSKQLRTLFEFFSKVPHDNGVVFIWDCDQQKSVAGLAAANNTWPMVIPPNEENKLATKGIENAFPESRLERFVAETKKADGRVIRVFDESQKSNFASYMVESGGEEDFAHFRLVIDQLRTLLEPQ